MNNYGPRNFHYRIGIKIPKFKLKLIYLVQDEIANKSIIKFYFHLSESSEFVFSRSVVMVVFIVISGVLSGSSFGG